MNEHKKEIFIKEIPYRQLQKKYDLYYEKLYRLEENRNFKWTIKNGRTILERSIYGR